MSVAGSPKSDALGAEIDRANSERLKVLFVSQWFPPEPAQIPMEIAQALASQRDMSVRVLTGVPNYPQGRTYNGYSALRPRRERIAGLLVDRVPLIPYHGASVAGRALNYLSFATTSALAAMSNCARADIVVIYSSPASATLPAIALRTLFGTPYVSIVQDLWPDAVTGSGLAGRGLAGRIVARTSTWIAQASYGLSATLVAITDSMRIELVERGHSEAVTQTIYNWDPMEPDGASAGSDATDNRFSLRRQLNLRDGTFIILYSGNLGSTHALTDWLEAMEALNRISTAPTRDVHLVIMGLGVARGSIEGRARSMKLTNVHFLDPLPIEQYSQARSQADVVAVSLAKQALLGSSLPSKVQGGLGAGCILLAYADGETARVVREAGGVAVTSGVPRDLCMAIAEISHRSDDDLLRSRKAALEYYQAHMSRRAGSEMIASVVRLAARGVAGKLTYASVASVPTTATAVRVTDPIKDVGP